ncbi:MAG: GNA1162 family protein [Myxococcales bacterium]
MRPTALLASLLLAGCASGPRYQDKKMDFGAIKTVAVLPLQNLSRDNLAGDRVRDVFSTMLLSTGAAYVLPSGEVNRALVRGNVQQPATPSQEEVVALGKLLSADALFVGTVKEYGEVRSGNSAANAISMSMEVFETQTGKVIWAASTTRGGIGFWDRMLGGGGEPMNRVTEDAVRDLLNNLFK